MGDKTRYSFKLRKGRYTLPDVYEVRKGGKTVAMLQKQGSLWFSYGMGGMSWNTSSSPLPLDEAKKVVLELPFL